MLLSRVEVVRIGRDRRCEAFGKDKDESGRIGGRHLNHDLARLLAASHTFRLA